MNRTHPDTLRDLAIRLAWGCLNIPYIWGGQDPLRGLDCSGLIVWIFRTLGIFAADEDYTAHGLWLLYRQTKKIQSPKPGALVFYGKNRVTHVAICVDYEYCICASGGGKFTKIVEDARKKKAYVKLKKIHYRGDIWGYANPFLEN